VVTNINSGHVNNFSELEEGPNGVVYFKYGSHMYKTDGTTSGTALVAADTQLAYSAPVNVAGEIFFEGNNPGQTGRALWKSDGTQAGTVLVTPINDSPELYASASIGKGVDLNGKFIFPGSDNTHGAEIWVSDGTSAGTILLKEINGQGNSAIQNTATMGGYIYFSATDGVHGAELWKSDGTDAGTVIVRDINPTGNSSPHSLYAIGNTLFFFANDGVHGAQLWKTDGTGLGTVMVAELIANGSAGTSKMTSANSVLYLTTNSPSRLWRSDGTVTGTVNVRSSSNGISFLEAVGDHVYFNEDHGTAGYKLWRSDGTLEGTFVVKDFYKGSGNPNNAINVNGTLFFAAYNDANATELWKTDGTEAGTVKVTNFDGAYLSMLLKFNNNVIDGVLYFTLFDGGREELWKTDGTPEGTVKVKGSDIITNDRISAINGVNGELYFMFNNSLWKTDGTDAGTVLIVETLQPYISQPSFYLVNGNDKLYVIASKPDKLVNQTAIWGVNKMAVCNFAHEVNFSGYEPRYAAGKIFLLSSSVAFGGTELFAYDTAENTACGTQVITFKPFPQGIRAGDLQVLIDAIATSKLPLTFTSSDASVAAIYGQYFAPVSAGTATITAHQEGNENWGAAVPVSQTVTIDVILSIEEDLLKTSCAYPNPFTDSFLLRINTRASYQHAEVSVFRPTGKALENIGSLSTNTNHSLGSDWPAGMYIVQVKTAKTVFVQKVVKK
jgi:ELWxxDGT repeat protein